LKVFGRRFSGAGRFPSSHPLLAAQTLNRLSAALPGAVLFFCEMPGVAPGAAIGAKLFWGGGGGDLVRGGGQGLALGGVFALAGYRAFSVAFGHGVFPAS